MQPDAQPVFSADGLCAVEISSADIPVLQRFFEANPEYFHAVSGEAPAEDEAVREFRDDPPAGWNFTRKWLLGFVDGSGAIVGTASVVSDLLATHVWHIGLFMVGTERQGKGDAQILYRALESWAAGNGAHWIRLGVVKGNARAERFWERAGFVLLRKREAVEMGQRVNTLLVMAKPLAGGKIADYLALVERDRPGSSA